jgi:hypothetical protein
VGPALDLDAIKASWKTCAAGHEDADVARLIDEDMPTLIAEIERLRAEIGRGAAPPPQTWQPIETAPKDGTLIDVWLGDGSAEDVEFYCASRRSRRSTNWHWREGKFRPFVGLGMPIVTVRPTHWMALPAPPEGERT